MKPVGKPDAGNPHVRFDERGRETGRRCVATPAPALDSTGPTLLRNAYENGIGANPVFASPFRSSTERSTIVCPHFGESAMGT
jgi:hypothetical protein